MSELLENKTSIELTARMIRMGHEPHSVIICGERGLGKKTLARHLAKQLLCERGDGVPCNSCRSCRLIDKGVHPDVITAQPSDTGNYRVEDIREIASSAYIAPNESKYKVYIIPDLDASVQTLDKIQNIMLKLIEEPPDSAVIILTARSKEIFLETIISRTLLLEAEPVGFASAQAYLIDKGYDKAIAEEAVRRNGANIGKCLEYAENDELRSIADAALEASAAIASSDEYTLMRVLSVGDYKKDEFITLLSFMQRITRDATRLKAGASTPHPYSSRVCTELGQAYSQRRLVDIYNVLGEHINRAAGNCLVSALVNSLCAGLMTQE